MNEFFERALRVFKLESGVYDEIEEDPASMGQAMGVVLVSSIAAGIGTYLEHGIAGVVMGTIAAFMTWCIWVLLIYFLGVAFLFGHQTRADLGELLRMAGFASAPGIIRIVAVIPALTRIVFFIASVWMLIAMAIATRQALDYAGIWKSLGVCFVGWLVQLLIFILFFSMMGI